MKKLVDEVARSRGGGMSDLHILVQNRKAKATKLFWDAVRVALLVAVWALFMTTGAC